MRISDWSSDVCSSDLMGVDRVTPLIGGGDLGDRAVGLAYPGLDRRDTDDGAVGVGLDILALAEFDIMRAPIGRLDDQIVAIVDLVGQAALDHPSDQRAGIRRRSEEHTSELQSLMRISYAVFCLTKKHILFIIYYSIVYITRLTKSIT